MSFEESFELMKRRQNMKLSANEEVGGGLFGLNLDTGEWVTV